MTNPDSLVGSYAPDFELPGIDDRVHHLSEYLEKYQGAAVLFMGNHCPTVRLYLERLKQIQSDFESQNLTLIGVNANDAKQQPEDSFEQMKTFASAMQLNFPYLWDSTQDVAHCFGVEKTPEVFLLDGKGIIRYRGAIDDNPEAPEAVQKRYLRDAIAALLKGETIATSYTPAIGCPLKWAK